MVKKQTVSDIVLNGITIENKVDAMERSIGFAINRVFYGQGSNFTEDAEVLQNRTKDVAEFLRELAKLLDAGKIPNAGTMERFYK